MAVGVPEVPVALGVLVALVALLVRVLLVALVALVALVVLVVPVVLVALLVLVLPVVQRFTTCLLLSLKFTKTHLDVPFRTVSRGSRVPQGPFSEGPEKVQRRLEKVRQG